MGWFDEQIKQRKANDRELIAESYIGIAGAVMGRKLSVALQNERLLSQSAMDEILKFYHIKPQELPDSIEDVNEQLEFLLRPHGIMRRSVELKEGWYRDAMGAMLGMRKGDNMPIALIPSGLSGYSFLDPETGKRVKVTKRTESLLEREALAFYKPLPLKSIGIRDLLGYIVQSLSAADIALFGLAVLAVTLVGMLLPAVNRVLFSQVLSSKSMGMLVSTAVFLVCVRLGSLIFSAVQGLLETRIRTKLSISVEAASMMRVLSLPADFFRQYSTGELTQRTQLINELCSMLVSSVLGTGFTSLFSLIYLSQIAAYAPALALPALLVILLTFLFSVASSLLQMRISKQHLELASKESGMSFALISGVQKIKLSGSENRAFARWGKLYAKMLHLVSNPPLFLKINSAISLAISLVGTIVMYYMAVTSGVTDSNYYAFSTAYGMVSGAFMSLSGIALTLAQIKPVLDMVEPILSAVPEVSENKTVLTRLSGGVELSNVSFRYGEKGPLILDDLSLKIRPGQYVAIVGRTGCGKSTLMRLLLGFETPQRGAIYYDGADISKLDLKSLRQKIGVVMQSGKLFQGDIFANIAISAPQLTLDEAWEAAELSGIADDIRAMPMGMYTMVSEGGGGISGGQRQRLMIARAIAPKPKILMFDEATSALDNLTQKKVSESLDRLKCTRIVIAHRLSTIRQCDRILVLDGGKIIEDGTYEELLERNGFFAELVARQRLDDMESPSKKTEN